MGTLEGFQIPVTRGLREKKGGRLQKNKLYTGEVQLGLCTKIGSVDYG